MIPDDVIGWTLADDRRSLTVTRRRDEGHLTTTLEWPEPATDELVQAALNDRPLPRLQVGERRYARRWVFGKRTLWFHKMSGPPTWWWPRCFPHEGALIVGWLRRAIAVAVEPTGSTGGSTGESVVPTD